MADGKETLDKIVKDVVEGDKAQAKAILDSLRGQKIESLSDLGEFEEAELEETLKDAQIKPVKTRVALKSKLKEYIKKGTITHWNSLTTFAHSSLSICYCSKRLVYFSRPPPQVANTWRKTVHTSTSPPPSFTARNLTSMPLPTSFYINYVFPLLYSLLPWVCGLPHPPALISPPPQSNIYQCHHPTLFHYVFPHLCSLCLDGVCVISLPLFCCYLLVVDLVGLLILRRER